MSPQKRTPARKRRTSRKQRDLIDSKKVMRDLRRVLKVHGITSSIDTVTFGKTQGASCTCPKGGTGVLRVVGGKLICVCPD